MLDIGLLPQAIRRYAEGSDVSALKFKRRSSFYRLAKSLAYLVCLWWIIDKPPG